ncbi:DNA (cytosine-5-)-methyltransferase [Methylobrevis albus]|uniref:Cytosine-specific methyltransferase n=1 Tax=Methylobrevis albus TaxID=2793297 RepID=A0A931I299_9HYPH|nr:DNA (cytosine-5-)-methyltransferase [Methylobrevis albus]MBH0238935.1 DNA (cytosine-5-)-methyltransferase [Methylobrevis albus]
MLDESRSNFSRLRERAGISVEALAPLVGYSPATVYRWERGESLPRQAALTVLEDLVRGRGGPELKEPAFRFIDLFAGIGGIRRGFEPFGGKCVFTSEWDRWAQTTYSANFPHDDHEITGDITKVKAEDIPEHDLLLAGFPCQPFSIAGVSKKNALGRAHGFADETQGTLFFDVARIIAEHRPKAFLLENVKNLVNHDRGHTFKVIMARLRDLGYHVPTPRVINAKGYVPQHRERILIAGFREECDFTFDDLDVPSPLNGPRLSSILHPEDGTETPERPFTGPDGRVSQKYVLTDHLWRYLQDYAAKHRAAGNGFGFGLVGPGDVARTLSARYYKDGSEILIDRGPENNPRRLTPRECARLMGFDRSGSPQFVIPVSDTQAYKQFGNSVAVPVIEAVARHMAPWITTKASLDVASEQERPQLFA